MRTENVLARYGLRETEDFVVSPYAEMTYDLDFVDSAPVMGTGPDTDVVVDVVAADNSGRYCSHWHIHPFHPYHPLDHQ